jgi:hypothetical protein
MAHISMHSSSVENSALVLSCGLSLSTTEPSYVTSRLRRPGPMFIIVICELRFASSGITPSKDPTLCLALPMPVLHPPSLEM